MGVIFTPPADDITAHGPRCARAATPTTSATPP